MVFVRVLTAIACALSLSAASVSAQGPLYRERWGFLHLEHRRAELRAELAGRKAADVAAVATMLAEPDGGVPFVPVARALARLRGVEADELFLFRAMLGVFLLPEIVDPEATNELCRSLNVSAFLPFAVPVPADLALELVVVDREGARVADGRIVNNLALEDLRMGRATHVIPCAELADGTYELRVLVHAGEAGPGAKDPVLSWPFHVLRGYQRRSEAAMAAAKLRVEGLAAVDRALLEGLAAEVSRAYLGEAFAVGSDAARQLELLEQALRNLEQGKSVLHGVRGDVATALPAGERSPVAPSAEADVPPLPCVLVDYDAARKEPRPVVVVATGVPSYDTTLKRPNAPSVRDPMWSAREIATLRSRADVQWVCLGSPGDGRPYPQSLQAALEALSSLLPADSPPPLLVCEREAAGVVAFALKRLAPQVGGFVLIGGGAMPQQQLDGLDRPVRFVPLAGFPGSAAVERVLDYVAATPGRSDVAWLAGVEQPLPWTFGLPLALPAIERMASAR
jgi:hypothetical protein